MGLPGFLAGLSRSTCPLQSWVSGKCVIYGPPPANYDEQAVLFEPTTMQRLATNVTVTEASDANGYGPAYLLNGLTNAGYWYQVGVAYDWSIQGGGYTLGFGYIYAVFGPNSGPNSPAQLQFVPAAISAGDNVSLALGFSGGDVVMDATDSAGPSHFSRSFDAMGANVFLGTRGASPPAAYFTGWMTEWRHSERYDGQTALADYTLSPAVVQAYVGIDEWTPLSNRTIFTCAGSANLTSQGVYDFSGHNVIVSVNSTLFATGVLTSSSATIENMSCSP
jgi:hypothetical protein